MKKIMKESELKKQADQIDLVKFIENGQENYGFYKKLGPEDSEVLVKLSFTNSVMQSLITGEHMADKRLVFDEHGAVVGVLSIYVDKFKPYQFFDETTLSDEPLKDLIKPNIEELMAGWFINEDDKHYDIHKKKSYSEILDNDLAEMDRHIANGYRFWQPPKLKVDNAEDQTHSNSFEVD